MPETKTEKCAHPACKCSVENESRFCSTECEEAGDREAIFCHCGHAVCAAQKLVF